MEARCDWETPNDFLEVLPRSTEYGSQGESRINQAATDELREAIHEISPKKRHKVRGAFTTIEDICQLAAHSLEYLESAGATARSEGSPQAGSLVQQAMASP